VDGTPYVRRVRLPEAMGGGVLTARLKPDRIWLQSLDVGPDGVEALQRAAAETARLRAEPNASAKVTDHLGEGGAYRENRAYRITDSTQDWVYLKFDGGGGGWTSVDAFCAGACRELLDTATFINDVVALTSGLSPREVPQSLPRDAAAMAEQLAALVALADRPRHAVEIAEAWAGGLAGGPPPGGAGFANLLAVARVAKELEAAMAAGAGFDRIQLDHGTITGFARDLAEASVADPGDLDVVENLAVLFGYLGDEKRRALALQIAADLKAR
jgi:hypothetical protein